MIQAACVAQLSTLPYRIPLHSSKRRPAYSSRSRPLRRPEGLRSSRTSAIKTMASSGIGGYANWALAMLTSVPIWAGGGAVMLWQFARKCGTPSHYAVSCTKPLAAISMCIPILNRLAVDHQHVSSVLWRKP